MIEEGGKFAANVLAPINQRGDEQGCVLDKTTHEVTAPDGFKAAYAQYVEGGWPALSCDPAFGGQGLPHLVNQCMRAGSRRAPCRCTSVRPSARRCSAPA